METYSLYIASVTERRFQAQAMTFAYCLVSPSGEMVHGEGTPEGETLLAGTTDPYYAAMLSAVPHVPSGATLRVVTDQEYLNGRSTGPGSYAGVMNDRAADRIAAGYRRPKKGPRPNEVQLRELDALLTARDITTVGERPGSAADASFHGRMKSQAKALIGFDPDVPGY